MIWIPSNFWIFQGSDYAMDYEYVRVPRLALEQATLIFEMELFYLMTIFLGTCNFEQVVFSWNFVS